MLRWDVTGWKGRGRGRYERGLQKCSLSVLVVQYTVCAQRMKIKLRGGGIQTRPPVSSQTSSCDKDRIQYIPTPLHLQGYIHLPKKNLQRCHTYRYSMTFWENWYRICLRDGETKKQKKILPLSPPLSFLYFSVFPLVNCIMV